MNLSMSKMIEIASFIGTIGWNIALWMILIRNWRWFYAFFGLVWSVVVCELIYILPRELELFANPPFTEKMVFYVVCFAPLPLIAWLAYRWLKQSKHPKPSSKDSS